MSDSQESQTCPLTWPEQRRNLAIFALCTGMQYLAAPLLYVGITQGALGRRLEADERTANLPQTLFFAMMAVPALIAWASPRVASLKRNLSLCYFAVGLMQGIVALTLLSDASNAVKIGVLILQGGTAGALISTAIALLWEVVARGTEESRRGLALGLAFGLGPIFAIVGSFLQTVILGGKMGPLEFAGLEYPMKFAVLFGAGVPILWTAALLGQFCIVPPTEHEPRREPASQVAGLLVGVPAMFAAVFLLHAGTPAAGAVEELRHEVLALVGVLMSLIAAVAILYHFRTILRSRLLFGISLVTILLYAGNGITTNMNLYSEDVLGNLPEFSAGVQQQLRFGFKMATGLVLGWLLARTNPRTGLVATAALLLASQLWAMFANGPMYLVAFGIYGAGELVGVYAPNYLVSASRASELRRNMAYATLLMVPAAPASFLYGSVVRWIKTSDISTDAAVRSALGFRASFATCAAVIALGLLLALALLPARPTPDPSSEEGPSNRP